MNLMRISLCAGAALGCAALIASSASATTVIAVSGGPFDTVTNNIGTIDGFHAVKGDTYDFTFTLQGSVNSATQAQIQAVFKGLGQAIPFTLFAGSPGSGLAVADSVGTTGPTLQATIAPGSYYLETSSIAANGELVSGSVDFAAVPEPATWGVMLLGFGAMGASMRRKRSQLRAA
jgi:hypothetical protein